MLNRLPTFWINTAFFPLCAHTVIWSAFNSPERCHWRGLGLIRLLCPPEHHHHAAQADLHCFKTQQTPGTTGQLSQAQWGGLNLDALITLYVGLFSVGPFHVILSWAWSKLWKTAQVKDHLRCAQIAIVITREQHSGVVLHTVHLSMWHEYLWLKNTFYTRYKIHFIN